MNENSNNILSRGYLIENEHLENIISFLRKDIHDIYRKNWTAIRSHYREHFKRKHSWGYYNIRWKSQTSKQQWCFILKSIFYRQNHAFKINFSHSFILGNIETKQKRYFHSSKNQGTVLDIPFLITNYSDLQTFIKKIEQCDILSGIIECRPSSSWKVEHVCSTTFYVDAIVDTIIGCTKHIKQSLKIFKQSLRGTSVAPLISNRRGKIYNDKLCVFRCLVMHFHRYNINHPEFELKTKKYAKRWVKYCGSKKHFTLSNLPQLERLFKINIIVYKKRNDTFIPYVKSVYSYQKTMYVLLTGQHFSFIRNINVFTKTFICKKCKSAVFPTLCEKIQHEKFCNYNEIKHVYKGGVYNIPPSPIETLIYNGIDFPRDYRYEYFISFDFESWFKKTKHTTNKTNFYARHYPLSVGICSNVPTFSKAVCFVTNGSTQHLVDRMFEYMESIQKHAVRLLRKKFKYVFKQIIAHPDSTNLNTILSAYIEEIPVIGYNSSKYDINLIKPYFINKFLFNEKCHVIKRRNEYIAISTPKFRFLDLIHFTAGGSYASCLKAYNINEKKGFWCYEYIDDLDKLYERQLPPKECFYSKLKDENISDQDYRYCTQIWKELNMQTLKDFLIWYNLKDVHPLLKLIERMSKEFHSSLKIDIFKEAISIPGLTLKYLMKTIPRTVHLSLIDKRHKDLHDIYRSNICGGPAMILRRYHEKDITLIRNKTHKVKKIWSYDCSSLYLFCLMKNHCTEHFIRRRKINSYRAEKGDVFGQMSREWLEYESYRRNINITHKFNGKEVRLGPRNISVDGFHKASNTVFQFHGNAFHGKCNSKCHKHVESYSHPFNRKLTEEYLHKTTQDITCYLKRMGYRVIEMYECCWKHLKTTSNEIKHFLCKNKIGFKSVLRPHMSLNAILKKVKNDKLFGFVLCSLHVPLHLQEKFSDFQPIFKNAMVSIDDIGSHMKRYCLKNKLMSQPRRALIGSYFGDNILLGTPLLKWYIEKGFIVTDIQEIIEYKPKRCFKKFGKTCIKQRRLGDIQTENSTIANIFKLLQNSAYGKFLQDNSKHRHIVYTKDPQPYVRNCRFLKQTSVTKGISEIEMKKKLVLWKTPLQIGLMVYMYAKLRILEFLYDCLHRFLIHDCWELLASDTDSYFFAVSGNSIHDIIKEDMRSLFYDEYDQWFVSESCKYHRQLFKQIKMNKKKWNPKPCCIRFHKYDSRTPGKFHVEAEADGMVCLSSKTYICYNKDEHDTFNCVKSASKGISKKLNKFNVSDYLNVIKKKRGKSGINRGFKVVEEVEGSNILTYEQSRAGLGYLYIKRRVGSDGITTKPTKI